jgi:hypothetical protein
VSLRGREQLRPLIPCRGARLQRLALTLELVDARTFARPDCATSPILAIACGAVEHLADRVGRRPVLPLLRARRELRGRVRVVEARELLPQVSLERLRPDDALDARPTTSASGPFGFASAALRPRPPDRA